MYGADFVKWREELPRTRVDDKTLKAIIAAKTRNPKTPNRTLAKKYKVSETTVSNFTVHLKRGEPKTLDQLRIYVSTRYLKNECVSCSKIIKRGNDGLCRQCHTDKNRVRSGLVVSKIRVESCDESPSRYHHWIIDVYSRGKCKYCTKEQQYYPWEDLQAAGVQTDF